MGDLRSLSRKTAELLTFVADPRKDIEVFGMFGASNLGDEAMLVAARDVLGRRRTVPWKTYPHNSRLTSLVMRRVHRHLLVAGGTLIHGGQEGWLNYVETRFDQKADLSFFGTGMAFTEAEISEPSDRFRRWARILRATSEVNLRGPLSVRLCEMMGARARVFGDFAFLLHDPAIPLVDHGQRRDIIGLNFGNCQKDQDAFEGHCADLVRSLHPRHQLVFHVVVPHDLPPTRRIIQKAGLDPGRMRIEMHCSDPAGFMQAVRDHRAFLGLKMHAAGLAMIAGVPSLMIAYLPKCDDFMAPLTESRTMLVDLPLAPGVLEERLDAVLKAPDDFILTERIAAMSLRQRGQLQAHFGTG